MLKPFFVVYILAAQWAIAQEAAVVKFDRVHALIESQSDGINVINFWATWCAPCVKEIPLFEALNAKNDPTIKVTLINLDFVEKLDKVNLFISRKNMKSEVLLLDEIDYNSWIDKVDKRWGGAIPATLVINQKTGQRRFIDRPLGEGDLEKMIFELRNQ
ncbi:MAG: TlpA family protein disulfide reductase [Cyclobacteriaceae bacterium]|nr:TlpA family protein disulfide reductase [Cyclobacteriaceae bacterium]MDH4295303.1 TlpA family protein disulfide reductase [Cyclobacteriaceae bacterium]MDH5249707.1 TlpA family protein disulfide reductase [Cyclobacteriaceae bacterium]